MKTLRSLLFWAHLVCGVVAGIVILMMCVTGVVLTYQRQLQYWADIRDYRVDPPAGTERATVPELIAAAVAAVPDTEPGVLTLRADPTLPASVVMGTKTIYLNPYTAGVHGPATGDSMRAFMASMVSWHRYVAMSGDSRTTGRAITGASNLAFLFIVLSGMYLWWPKSLTWPQIRNVIWFRRRLPGKARDFNWHTTIGFWSAIPLAVVVYSGVVISYPWASNMVYHAVGEAPPIAAAARGAGAGPAAAGQGGRGGAGGERGRGAAVDSEFLFREAMRFRSDWTIVSARVPATATAPVVFTVDRGDGGQPQLRGTLTMNATTGAVEKWEGFETLSTGRQLRSFLRFAHTGEYFGLKGQTVAGLVSAGGAVLVYTGTALAFRRLLHWRSRRRRASSPAFVEQERRTGLRVGETMNTRTE